jgi:hypothetical protein
MDRALDELCDDRSELPEIGRCDDLGIDAVVGAKGKRALHDVAAQGGQHVEQRSSGI